MTGKYLLAGPAGNFRSFKQFIDENGGYAYVNGEKMRVDTMPIASVAHETSIPGDVITHMWIDELVDAVGLATLQYTGRSTYDDFDSWLKDKLKRPKGKRDPYKRHRRV
jgi:hypothetical protein